MRAWSPAIGTAVLLPLLATAIPATSSADGLSTITSAPIPQSNPHGIGILPAYQARLVPIDYLLSPRQESSKDVVAGSEQLYKRDCGVSGHSCGNGFCCGAGFTCETSTSGDTVCAPGGITSLSATNAYRETSSASSDFFATATPSSSSSASSSSSSNSSDNLSASAIAGLVVGGLVILCILGVWLWACLFGGLKCCGDILRKRRHKKEEQLRQKQFPMQQGWYTGGQQKYEVLPQQSELDAGGPGATLEMMGSVPGDKGTTSQAVEMMGDVPYGQQGGGASKPQKMRKMAFWRS